MNCANFFQVAIPHGGLRTSKAREVIAELRKVAIPHGGLRTRGRGSRDSGRDLSPSHTVGLERIHFINDELVVDVNKSPSHTVGLEPQITTLTKIRHINNFVKGAPFSNEVNFPKSEIMQS